MNMDKIIFSIKRDHLLESIMDELIRDNLHDSVVYIQDSKSSRKLSKCAKPLRKKRLLHISTDDFLREPIAMLKKNSYHVRKERTNYGIWYIFE